MSFISVINCHYFWLNSNRFDTFFVFHPSIALCQIFYFYSSPGFSHSLTRGLSLSLSHSGLLTLPVCVCRGVSYCVLLQRIYFRCWFPFAWVAASSCFMLCVCLFCCCLAESFWQGCCGAVCHWTVLYFLHISIGWNAHTLLCCISSYLLSIISTFSLSLSTLRHTLYRLPFQKFNLKWQLKPVTANSHCIYVCCTACECVCVKYFFVLLLCFSSYRGFVFLAHLLCSIVLHWTNESR